MTVVENPANGYQEKISNWSILWTFCFGPFYLGYKAAWSYAFIVLLTGLFMVPVVIMAEFAPSIVFYLVHLAVILSCLILGLGAPRALARAYLHRGWRIVSSDDPKLLAEAQARPKAASTQS